MRISIFAESVKRLYRDDKLDKDKIMELYKEKKITIEETNYILDSNKDSNAL